MKFNKAVVTTLRKSTQAGYRLTLYLGIVCDSGPSEAVTLEGLTDLYLNFNTYTNSPSFKMAEFCLTLGYRVIAKRVNWIMDRATCTQFQINGKKTYAQAKENINVPDIVQPSYYDKRDILIYSYILTLKDIQGIINENFVIVTPRYVEGDSGLTMLTSALYGKDTNEARSHINNTYGVTQDNMVLVDSENLVLSKFKLKLIEYLQYVCNCEVTELMDKSLIVESHYPMGLPLQENVTLNIQGSEEVLTSTYSSSSSHDTYYKLHFNDKVATFKSIVPSSSRDTKVIVTLSSGRYYISIYKYNLKGVPVVAESWVFFKDDVESINGISKIVTLEVHRPDLDISGVYELQGHLSINSESDFVNSVTDEVTESSPEIIIDNSDSSTLQVDYLRRLERYSPNSIILTDVDDTQLLRDSQSIVSISPKVKFGTSLTLKGLAYLLYLLPTNDSGSDSKGITIVSEGKVSEEVNQIISSDYSIILAGVRAKLPSGSVIPFKSKVMLTSFNSLMRLNSYKSKDDVSSTAYMYSETVSNYFQSPLRVSVTKVLEVEDYLVIYMDVSIDNILVTSYDINVTLNY